MAFEFAYIFFGSHQKREGITTPADGAVRIYKKVGKSLTTSVFFKKSGDIFFGATSQTSRLQKRFFLSVMRPTSGARWGEAPCRCLRQIKARG